LDVSASRQRAERDGSGAGEINRGSASGCVLKDPTGAGAACVRVAETNDGIGTTRRLRERAGIAAIISTKDYASSGSRHGSVDCPAAAEIAVDREIAAVGSQGRGGAGLRHDIVRDRPVRRATGLDCAASQRDRARSESGVVLNIHSARINGHAATEGVGANEKQRARAALGDGKAGATDDIVYGQAAGTDAPRLAGAKRDVDVLVRRGGTNGDRARAGGEARADGQRLVGAARRVGQRGCRSVGEIDRVGGGGRSDVDRQSGASRVSRTGNRQIVGGVRRDRARPVGVGAPSATAGTSPVFSGRMSGYPQQGKEEGVTSSGFMGAGESAAELNGGGWGVHG